MWPGVCVYEWGRGVFVCVFVFECSFGPVLVGSVLLESRKKQNWTLNGFCGFVWGGESALGYSLWVWARVCVCVRWRICLFTLVCGCSCSSNPALCICVCVCVCVYVCVYVLQHRDTTLALPVRSMLSKPLGQQVISSLYFWSLLFSFHLPIPSQLISLPLPSSIFFGLHIARQNVNYDWQSGEGRVRHLLTHTS